MDWYEETFRLTIVLLAASLTLLVPGSAGVGGSFALAVGLLVLGGALFALRDQFGSGPEAFGHDLGHYARALWAGPLVGAGVVVLGLSATPAELRALGGIVGLAGMANYFLRPVYRLLHGIVALVAS